VTPAGPAAPPRRSWRVAVLAGVALAVAAALGAYLVFQPDAATSSGAVLRLSRILYRHGVVPYARAADIVEFGLNVALFVPGAFAAALLWPRVRWWQWVLVGLAVSAAIETVQGVFLPARDAEPRDLVANTLGAALGAGAGLVLRRVASRGP
jgi:glycopeptide antibiotics resistance protein